MMDRNITTIYRSIFKRSASSFSHISKYTRMSYNTDNDSKIILVGAGLEGWFKKMMELKVIKSK